jgi:glycosyltransferase involved in cell wall biosynthesis
VTPSTDIDIIIPAFNEAARIGGTIAAVRSAVAGRVIVVDDGSADGTADVARDAGADVVYVQPRNRGKGAALNTGLALSRAPVLLLIDADLGETSAQVGPLADAVLTGGADLAVAAFPRAGRKSGVGFVQWLARTGIARRTGRVLRSPVSGQRCVRREWVERAGGFEEGWGAEVALTLAVLRGGGRVEEIELPLSHRKTGRDLAGWLHRARQARDVWRVLRRF